MPLLTARTSTILIATGQEIRVFSSFDEVPVKLRRQLEAVTRSSQAGTILIADQGGKAELIRAFQGQPTAVQCRVLETIRMRKLARQVRYRRRRVVRSARRWIEIAAAVVLGGSLWYLFESRF